MRLNSISHAGSPEIDPGYESDEATSKYFAHMHGARVLNLTDYEIIKEHAQFVYDNQSSSVIIIIVGWTVGSIVLGLVAVGAIAVLAYGCLRYILLNTVLILLYIDIHQKYNNNIIIL